MEPRHDTNRRLELVQSAWKRISTHLETARHRLYEEIRNYPRPIPACDQHFNYLLEERARITRELDRMHEAVRESLSRSDPVGPIEEFINSSSYLDDDARQTVRSSLKEGLSGPGA